MLTTIGLEVHCQLESKTKIFCGCAVRFGSAPNANVCPVCLGLPGSLPVLNREVFRLGVRAVLALGGEVSEVIKFDRKNYFYPDLPKGYQISQFDHPLGRGGFIEIDVQGKIKKIRLNRLHLEEDAGKLLHDHSPDSSHVDLNRAGTPLAEIVSEPDLDSPAEAYQYLTNLKAILKAVGVSACDMEKGQLRCDANVSVRKNAADPLGKRVEIKNLNSFKAVKSAIEYEVTRQSEALNKGEVITQETRLWDDGRGKTFPMRSKEDAHDYRYFPEPDLVPFAVTKKQVEEEKKSLPELPQQKKERLIKEAKVSPYNAQLLVEEDEKIDLFEKILKKAPELDSNNIANMINNSITAHCTAMAIPLNQTRLEPQHVIDMWKMILSGEASIQVINNEILLEVMKTGEAVNEIMDKKGLRQVSDIGALDGWINEVITTNPKVVQDFKSGKETAAMFLVGQVMKKSQGKANPGLVGDLMRKKLKEL